MSAVDVLRAPGRDGQVYYRSLPREYYRSEDVFEREFDRVFRRQWILIGHGCEIPEPGDFMTIDFAGENIIFVRAEDGRIRGHYNVCRHRGSRVCDATKGKTKAFVCPYHAWSYQLDGTLESAPTIPDREYVDYADYGLKSVMVDTHDGFIFMYLGDGEPTPLAEAFGAMEHPLPTFGERGVKVAHELVCDLQANWKIVAENNLECYHCPAAHKTLCAAMNVAAFKDEIATGARYAVQKHNFVGGSGHGAEVRPGAQSMTRSGNFAVRKLLGDFTLEDAGFSAGFHSAPLFGAALYWGDHFVTQYNYPQSAGRTIQKVQWFVNADAEAGVDYDCDELIHVQYMTVTEDAQIIERNARGVDSRTYTPGPLSKAAEPLNHVMLSLYLDWMGENSSVID